MFIVEQLEKGTGKLVHYHESDTPTGAYREFKRLTDEPGSRITRISDASGAIITRPKEALCRKAEQKT